MSKYIGDFADNAIVCLGAFTTNAAGGGRESFSAGLEEADITVYSDDGDGTWTAMTLDASTIIITENPGSQVGVYLVAVNMGNDADFATGKDYVAVLYPDETVDSQSVAGVLGHWSCENRGVQSVRGGLNTDGTITTLDALDTAQDTQHSTTQGKVDTAQADLDLLTGADGATLATAQGLYAPAKAGDEMDLVNAPNATAVTAIQSGLSTYAGGDTSGTTTLLSRLSAARAGYLDNLSAGAVATAAKLLAYFQLLFRSDAAIETDNATELTAINADGGSGAGNYSAQTDSVEAIRDRGDAAWTTATGFMLSSEDGSSFTAIPWNASWDAEVQSECEDALAAHIVDATGATVSLDQALKEVRSAMAGDYVGSGSGPYTIAFKAKDGSTTLFTWTVAADGSTRSVT